MSDNNVFFNTQTLSSSVKAGIVSEYFPRYCKIITKKYKPKYVQYIDLYAGPGIYKDGHESTPMLIAKKCYEDSYLRNLVYFLFNDKNYINDLKNNFLSKYPNGTFIKDPFFADRKIGEAESVFNFLKKSTMVNGMNESPSMLFFDPFGYKEIDTMVLAEFLKNWGNEIFLFVNTKRLNPAITNSYFQDSIERIYPKSFEKVKKEFITISGLQERLFYIINTLGNEFSILLGGRVFYTAFQFQEEDVNTTSHFILHLTKNPKGYELVKTIYNDFANVGTVFDGKHTYTFDPKVTSNPIELFDFNDENIETLSMSLYNKYKGKVIDALTLFKQDQIHTQYSPSHYVRALRNLVGKGWIKSTFIDNVQHKVTVLLSKDCLLDFEYVNIKD